MIKSSLWGFGVVLEVGSHRIFDICVKVYCCAKFYAGLTMYTLMSVLPLIIVVGLELCNQQECRKHNRARGGNFFLRAPCHGLH